jgi:hypothetical protein
MSQLAGCNMLINQLINSNFIDGNGLCIFCNTSLHLHNQVATPTSITTSSSSSASKLNKFLINDLPKWKKPYKTCTPFFTALEMLFSLHDVTDETLYKKYLQLSLSELPEHEKTYAYSHITSDSSLSWSRVKILFAERFESYDHVSRLEKQYAALKYNHDDTIQSFSHRFINLCSELSYDTDSRMAINNFMRLLPHDMHQRFLMQCHVRKMTISSFNSLDDIIADITAMENAYHSARFISSSYHENGTTSNNNNINNNNNNNSNNNNKSISRHVSPSKHVPTSSSPKTIKKCKHHPSSTGHTTEECRNPTPSPKPAFNPANHHSPGRSQPICFSCGEPGHLRPQCPNISKTSSSTIASGRVPPFVPPTLTRSGYVANGLKPTTPNPQIKTVTTSQSPTTSSTSSSSSSPSSSSNVSFKTLDRCIPPELFALSTHDHPTLLPIYIQGHLFYGLPDTGASSSCLDPLLPAKFGFTITPVTGMVKLANVNVQTERIGTCDITADIIIPDNNKSITFDHTFDVYPVFEYDKGYHFIIGRDILYPLFHQGLSSSLFTPDSHVTLPRFHDVSLSSLVDSISSTSRDFDASGRVPSHENNAHTSHLSSRNKNNISTISFNRLDFISSHQADIISFNQHDISTVSNEFKTLGKTMSDDLKSLSSDVHDLGAGRVPDNEVPVRPSLSSSSSIPITVSSDNSSTSTSFDLHSTTPDVIKQKYRSKLNTLLVYLCANEAIAGFCTLPGSQVELIIDESKKHLLFRRQYPIPQTLWSLANEVIKRWYDTGKTVLAPVGCEFNLPLTIAPKKDDNGQLTGIRVCLDTRILNAILLSTDKFLIPQIRDTIAMFANCSLFGEFDLSEAYLQFPLHPDSQKYTAFTWNGVQYMFAGCPFGINFIPSHFQRQLSQLFHDLPFTVPYFDNLPFGSKSWDEHLDHAIMIVDRLNKVNLRIKPSSVKIGRESMKCLGHILSINGIGIDPDKVISIRNHPYPPTGDNMMVFLGETGYISSHIRNYAELSAPLQAVKFQKKIEWTDEMKLSFDTLKEAVCRAPFLQFPDFSLPFHVATDASNTGIGGVLYQPKTAGEHITANNIVAIFSKILTECQRRYPAYKKELLGIVSCLRRFHSYIWGRNDLVIITDHKPLTYIQTSKQLSPSLQQWLDVILDYHFDIQHRDGILHVLPDRLSRIFTDVYASSTWGVESSSLSTIAGVNHDTIASSLPIINDNININAFTRAKQRIKTHLEEKEISRTHVSSYISSASDDSSASSPSFMGEDLSHIANNIVDDNIASIDSNNENIISIDNDNIHNNINPDTDYEHVVVEDDNDNNNDRELDPDIIDQDKKEIDLAIELEKRGKIIIRDINKRHELINNIHVQGHFGVSAIFNKLWHLGFWWPKIRNDIQQELANCDACIRFTVTKSGFHPFTPITATGPGDHYQIDLSTHLPPSSDGYTTLLAVIDVFTGFVILRAMRNSEMETVARKLWKIFCLIGWPRILQSDNGREFVNQVLQALMRLTGIDHRLISPYNPRADGKVERVIGSTMMIIKKLLFGAQHNWSIYVPFAQVTFNDKIASLTGSSPFALMFGRVLNQLKDYSGTRPDASIISLDNWKDHQDKILSIIYPAISDRIKGAKDKLAQTLTKHRRMLLPSSIPTGATVMIKDPVRENKFEPKYIGPYIIARRAYNGAYVLRDVDGDILDRHVPIDQIKIVSKTSRDKDQNTFVVKKILKHRGAPGSYEYLVQWKHFSDEYNSWEPQASFNDISCITKYWSSLNSTQ